MKMLGTLGDIYIYIVRFNKINLCKHRKKLCFLGEFKMSN